MVDRVNGPFDRARFHQAVIDEQNENVLRKTTGVKAVNRWALSRSVSHATHLFARVVCIRYKSL
jgi:hypothetical protein